jgi:Uri superfamily endonuclease
MNAVELLMKILREIEELDPSSGDDYFDDGYYAAVGNCMTVIEKYITKLKDGN